MYQRAVHDEASPEQRVYVMTTYHAEQCDPSPNQNLDTPLRVLGYRSNQARRWKVFGLFRCFAQLMLLYFE